MGFHVSHNILIYYLEVVVLIMTLAQLTLMYGHPVSSINILWVEGIFLEGIFVEGIFCGRQKGRFYTKFN